MFLSKIEPAETEGRDRGTFVCSTCDNVLVEVVKFREMDEEPDLSSA